MTELAQQVGICMEVCIISENAYPTSRGGVSEWCHSLISGMRDVRFNIFSISSEDGLRYILPKNVNEAVIEHLKSPRFEDGINESYAKELIKELRPALLGEPLNCEGILGLLRGRRFKVEELLGSDANWNSAVTYYKENLRGRAFAPFYIFWTSLFYLLYKTLEAVDKVPRSDIYHALNAGYAGVLGSLSKLNTGGALIVTEHGLYLKERRFEVENSEIPSWLQGMYQKFFESLVRTSYRYSDTVTSVCHDHTWFQREIEPNLKNIKVIYNGIDTERFRIPNPLNSNNRGHFNIGTVTRITPIKDILTFIRAAEHVLEKHKARFYIVGEVEDEEYFEECRELAEKLGLEKHIEFTGFKNSLDWYPKFDVFALPSLSEGLPLTILEALSCGVPCVATEVGGVPEILEEEFLVQKWDPKGLAEKICWLLDNPEERSRIGIEGRELVEIKFSLSKMVQGYRKLYEAMI
ncbi:MAG: GT4 family glycosyltransferase PelF [Candidatus Bathyarchaeia archaeon]